MTKPTNHYGTVINHYGNTITAPLVRVKELGDGKAEVDVETNYHIDVGYNNVATYTVPGNEAKGHYMVSGSDFTERMTYIYRGIFDRKGFPK